MNKYCVLILTILLASTNWCIAKHLHPEKFYQEEWCSHYNGIMEYKLKNKTRVDCLTRFYAVEFDFAPKWAECIGQALHYGIMTKKIPACVLIIEKPSDFKHYYKIEKVARVFLFRLWYIKPPEYEYKNF